MPLSTSLNRLSCKLERVKPYLLRLGMIFILGTSGNVALKACPGGEKWVSATSTLPDGWISTQKSSDGSQVYIKDVSCETLNATESMIYESPLPTGWVRTNEQIDPLSGYPSYTITCIKNAPFGTSMYALAGFSIPTDWVATNASNSGSVSFNYIKCLAGAPYGDSETILYWSTYPTGWIVTNGSGTYNTIQNQNQVTAKITTPASNLTINSGTSASFIGSATDTNTAATLNYAWNFGDGYTATGSSAAHTYSNEGTASASYTVTFKAWDGDSYYGTATRTITVAPDQPPVFTTGATQFVSSQQNAGPCYPATNPTPVNSPYVAVDPEGAAVHYALSEAPGYSLPANVSLTSTGYLQWNGLLAAGFVQTATTPGFGAIYECHVVVNAIDPHGKTTGFNVTLQFIKPPVRDCVPPPPPPSAA